MTSGIDFFSFGPSGASLRVKICGITSAADAEMALVSGAGALGFNFFPGSKRFLDFVQARPWISSLAGRTRRVAVVVNASTDDLRTLRDSGCFEAVQFHGDETPEFCASAGFPIWVRAQRIQSAKSFQEALRYETPFLLLDAWSDTGYGGTGRKLDWDAVREFVRENPDRRVILAGGLTPQNVREAIRIAKPYAVDVASGVERDPRHKDECLVREFIRAIS